MFRDKGYHSRPHRAHRLVKNYPRESLFEPKVVAFRVPNGTVLSADTPQAVP